MNKLAAAFALACVAGATPALAANVGISIRIGDPGFYGLLDIDSRYRPQVIQSKPVVVVKRGRNLAPVYLRVPRDHSRQWSRYCGRYNACARPVYFVRDEWYRDVYVPRYRERHAHYRHDDRKDHRHAHHHDRRDDHRDDRRTHRR